MRLFFALCLAVSVGLAMGLSPLASSSPDGLERVADDHGFAGQGGLHPVQQAAPVPDYAFPGIGDPRLATGLSGLAGTLAVLALGWGLVRVVRRPGG
ncbi:MAG: PDGLE domain-containing protein [Thermoleophilia bacterium]|jgi:hypothetical protein|nr:PDGLE domain-containing protein [Thermoleophilia bacterium]